MFLDNTDFLKLYNEAKNKIANNTLTILSAVDFTFDEK